MINDSLSWITLILILGLIPFQAVISDDKVIGKGKSYE